MNSLRQFEVVIAIAECGSISKAAKQLKVSQPTLSKFLINLEAQLETELFDRTKTPLVLTESGESFVRSGRRILSEYAQLNKDIDRIKNEKPDEVRVGISPTRASHILPTLLENFKKINSSAKLVVEEKTTSQLNSELLRGELDLIISLKYDGTRTFDELYLFEEKIMIAVNSSHKESDVMKVLKECDFISIGEGQRMAKALSDILRSVGGKEPALEVQSIASALALVEKGFGATLAPSYVTAYGRFQNIKFFELPESVKKYLGTQINREVCLFFKDEKLLTQSQKDFLEACKALRDAYCI